MLRQFRERNINAMNTKRKPQERRRILFVCTGNICRSPLAHGIFAKLIAERGVADCYEVESSGLSAYHVGDNVDRRMRTVAAARGVVLDHRARQFDTEDLHTYDLILVMDAGHMEAMRNLARPPELFAKVRLFREFDPDIRGDRDGTAPSSVPDVPDPWYGGMGGFQRVYAMVDRTCRALLEKLEAERAGAPCSSAG